MKKIKNLIKKFISKKINILSVFLLMLVTITLSSVNVKASYIYIPEGEVSSPEALTVTKIVDTSNVTDETQNHIDFNIGKLVDVASNKNNVFLVDSTNSRIVVLNNKYELVTYFPKETDAEQLSEPRGIFVTDQYIYVTDYKNFRIAIFDLEYNFVRSVGTPDDPTFKQPDDKDPDKYTFKPLKIAVDRTGRMYVFAENIFEGFIDLDSDGTFSRYVGANKVKVSAIEQFWLLFTSEEQKKAQGLRISDTLVNLTVDKEGYIYSVSNASEGDLVIKKLNSRGIDVLSRNGYTTPTGDQTMFSGNAKVPEGSSEFIDIDINEDDGYIVLDSKRGRIFAYDFEGNLLYLCGQIGSIGGVGNNRSDLFKSPEALCYFNDSILVVDSLNQNLVVFEYTDFAKKVNLATHYYKEGLYNEAAEIWQEILDLNSNYCLAYAGVGKAQLRNGDYTSAMTNLKLGYDYYNYSKAYQQYRYEKMTVIFPFIMAAVIILIVYALGRSIVKAVKGDKEEEKYE